MRKVKILGLSVLISALIFSQSSYVQVGAASTTTIKGNFSDEVDYSKCIGKPFSGLHRFWIYKYKKAGYIVDVMPDEFLTTPMYHVKGKAAQVAQSTKNTTIGANVTVNWNKKIGASVGIPNCVDISADNGFGVTTGFTVSKSLANSTTLNESFIKDGKTGYYAVAAGKPHYKMLAKEYNWITDDLKKKHTFYMPYGSTSTYTVYSTDNQKTWSVYK